MNESSAPPSARTIGVVYLSYFAVAGLGALLSKGIVVSGDAATTAANTLAHESLYRAGLGADLVANVIYIVLTVLLYRYFKPVNRTVASIAAFVSLSGCTVQIAGELLRIAPVLVLRNAHLATLFSAPQLQAAAFLSLTLHNELLRIAVALFAVFDFAIGYLIFRSTFAPSPLGVIMMAAGLGWATVLWPPLITALRLVILPLGGLAELLLMLWLVMKNVPARSEAPSSTA